MVIKMQIIQWYYVEIKETTRGAKIKIINQKNKQI